MRSLSRSLTAVAAVAFGVAAAHAESLDGRWSATVVQGGITIPFRLDISSDGSNVTGTLYNGDEKEITTSASLRDGKLELNFSSSTAHLSTVRRAIEQFSKEAGLETQASEEIGLVVNEALANIIRHAYDGKKDQPVRAAVQRFNGGVKILLRDWGNGVDPSTIPRPEHDPLVPGGLGLMCMRRLMDEVRYEPQRDGMLLVMTRTAAGSKTRPDDKTDFP